MLDSAIARRSNVVRKGIAYSLQIPRTIRRARSRRDEFFENPPIIVNSIPKSGTHLLMQIARALPDRRYYGSFLAQSPSLTLRKRSQAEIDLHISRIVPGEVVGCHLHYTPQTESKLDSINALNLFIYRDPRDIALSAAKYLSGMNRWNAMSRVVGAVSDPDEKLRIVIDGAGDPRFPSLEERVLPYAGWRQSPSTIAVRYEDLIGDNRSEALEAILARFAQKRPGFHLTQDRMDALEQAIAPERSHTYRAGGGGGWRTSMTPDQLTHFRQAAGRTIQALGYPD